MVNIKPKSQSVNSADPAVALVADQHAAENAEKAANALASTAGQGSAGIEDAKKAAAQLQK